MYKFPQVRVRNKSRYNFYQHFTFSLVSVRNSNMGLLSVPPKSPSTYGALPDCHVTVHATYPIYQAINNFDINVLFYHSQFKLNLSTFALTIEQGNSTCQIYNLNIPKLDGLIQGGPSFTGYLQKLKR